MLCQLRQLGAENLCGLVRLTHPTYTLWLLYRPCATLQVLYSTANPFYFVSSANSGQNISGLGSTHTPSRYVWPLAHMVLALMDPQPQG